MLRKLLFLLVSLSGGSLLSAQAVPPAMDNYGGSPAIRGAKTGFFHMEKIGPQWLFITPEGNGLYPLTVAAIYFNHPGLNDVGKGLHAGGRGQVPQGRRQGRHRRPRALGQQGARPPAAVGLYRHRALQLRAGRAGPFREEPVLPGQQGQGPARQRHAVRRHAEQHGRPHARRRRPQHLEPADGQRGRGHGDVGRRVRSQVRPGGRRRWPRTRR